jgi:hypothetical protein
MLNYIRRRLLVFLILQCLAQAGVSAVARLAGDYYTPWFSIIAFGLCVMALAVLLPYWATHKVVAYPGWAEPQLEPVDYYSADARAKDKLMRALTPQQRKSIEEHNFFDVVTKKKHVYRIYTAGTYSGNIEIIKPAPGRNNKASLCAHLNTAWNRYPVWDHYLAQAIMLRQDEAGFRKKAL